MKHKGLLGLVMRLEFHCKKIEKPRQESTTDTSLSIEEEGELTKLTSSKLASKSKLKEQSFWIR